MDRRKEETVAIVMEEPFWSMAGVLMVAVLISVTADWWTTTAHKASGAMLELAAEIMECACLVLRVALVKSISCAAVMKLLIAMLALPQRRA